MSRYEGKPFLRLLDCYVLHTIGELDADQAEALTSMEPKLATVYSQSGRWFEIVAKQMDIPAGLPDHVRKIWLDGKRKAANLGMQVDPKVFTQQFVDANFPT